MRNFGPCLCGDPYCSSCGPAQGYSKCRHGFIQGDCEEFCPNNEKYKDNEQAKALEVQYWKEFDEKFGPEPTQEELDALED